MSEHVKSPLKKASSRVRLLKKTRPFLDTRTAALIYNSMKVPRLIPVLLHMLLSRKLIRELKIRAQKIVEKDAKIPSTSKIVVVLFQGALAFNKLPINLRKKKDILKFKSLLKQW